MGAPYLGRLWMMNPVLPFPLAKTPKGEQHTQVITFMDIELSENGGQAILDRVGGDVHAQGDLLIGVSQADKRHHILFARG